MVEQFLTRMLMMPTAIVIEDAHWLDDASQLVLAKLAQPGPAPVARRRHAARRRARRSAERRQSSSSSRSTTRRRARSRSPRRATIALSDAALAALTERAGGNPLFMRELVVAPAGAEALPETVETLITSRIDTLDPGDRLLLRYASVIGARFDARRPRRGAA